MDENFDPSAGQPENAPPPDTANKDALNWAMLCHLAGLAGYIVPIPLANIAGPLIVWSMKRRDFAFVDDQGKEAINFQISMAIYAAVAALTICIGVGFVLLPAIVIAGLVLTIIAAIKASNGETYRYPLTLRLVK